MPIQYIDISKFHYEKKENCYAYQYEEHINLKFYCSSSYLCVNTTVKAVTGKNYISFTEKDKNEYLSKLKIIVCSVLTVPSIYDEIPKMISRIDYKIDVITSSELEKSIYIKFLTQLDDNHLHLKKRKDYESSKYLTGKYTMRRINLYDRYARTHKEEDKFIIRLEVQNLKRAIVSNKKKYGISRDFENYLCEDMFQELYISILRDYMLIGAHYYKIKTAYKLINNSDYTAIIKKRLKKFLRDTQKYDGLTGIRKHYDRLTRKKYMKLLQNIRSASVGTTRRLCL